VTVFGCSSRGRRPAQLQLVYVYCSSFLPDSLYAVDLVHDIVQPLLDYGYLAIPFHPLRRSPLVETQV